MKIFLDQMLGEDIADALRANHHDVLRAAEIGNSRSDDEQILATALRGGRILITLDEHFGNWVVLPLSHHPGVIRVKTHPTTARNVIKLLVPFLNLHRPEEFENRLVILSGRGVRWINTARN